MNILLNPKNNEYIKLDASQIALSVLGGSVAYTHKRIDGFVIETKNVSLQNFSQFGKMESTGLKSSELLEAFRLEFFPDFEVAGSEWIGVNKLHLYLIPSDYIAKGVAWKANELQADKDYWFNFNFAIGAIMAEVGIDLDLVVIPTSDYSGVYADQIDPQIEDIINPLIADDTIKVLDRPF